MAKITFNNKDSVFFTALKSDVDQYFKANNLKKTGNWNLYIKTLVLIPLAITLYLYLLFGNGPAVVSLFACAILGFTFASIGFNVMHDACHGSFSSKKWVNEIMSLTLNALGGNAFIWKFKHNIIHHTYTNVDGIDDDIAKSPLMRQCASQPWVPAHRYQHIYVILVYAISSFAWVFLMDFNKYLNKRVYKTAMTRITPMDHFVFWLSKALYVVFYVVIPIQLLGASNWAIGFTVMHITMGLTLALVFQLAHVVEGASFEFAGSTDRCIENEWAIHQIKTTADFSAKNKLVSWLVGGLNFQIEHHLFPRISHVHYPAISELVKKNCEKFNLEYNYFPTVSSAIASHFRMMKELGQNPVVAGA